METRYHLDGRVFGVLYHSYQPSRFLIEYPAKHSSSRYPASAPQIPTFWVARSVHDLLRDKHMHMRIVTRYAVLAPFVNTTHSLSFNHFLCEN